jgi:hypothetical protein
VASKDGSKPSIFMYQNKIECTVVRDSSSRALRSPMSYFSIKKPPGIPLTHFLVHDFDQIRSDTTNYIATLESASNRRWPMRLFKFKPQNRLTVIIRLWNSVRPGHGSLKLYALKQWKANKSFLSLVSSSELLATWSNEEQRTARCLHQSRPRSMYWMIRF